MNCILLSAYKKRIFMGDRLIVISNKHQIEREIYAPPFRPLSGHIANWFLKLST